MEIDLAKYNRFFLACYYFSSLPLIVVSAFTPDNMEINFEELMKKKSEEDLQKYINDSKRYVPEAIQAAVNELKNRKIILNEDVLIKVNSEIEQKKIEQDKENESHWDTNVVVDYSAPLLYSEKTIWRFTFLFGAVTGAILMAVNFNNLGKKKEMPMVLIFGIGYTLLTIWAIVFIERNYQSSSGLALIFNALAVAVFTKFFWRKYIGKETKYRKRKVWMPLIICIAVSILLLFVMIYSQNVD